MGRQRNNIGVGLRNCRLKLREELRKNLEHVRNPKKEERLPMETFSG